MSAPLCVCGERAIVEYPPVPCVDVITCDDCGEPICKDCLGESDGVAFHQKQCGDAEVQP